MKRLHGSWFIVSVLLLFLLTIPGGAMAQGKAEAKSAKVGPPVTVEVQWQDEMPEPPEGACPECKLKKVHRTPPLPKVDLPKDHQAPDVPETIPQIANPQAPGDFKFWRNHKLNDTEAPSVSNVCEPTAASKDKTVIYTGNWFAARSTNYGGKFTYVNPYTVFTPPTGMVFCCDQEVIYDRSRGIFIWSLLYITPTASGGCNRIALSKDGKTWWYYDFNYSTTNLPDYPHLRLSDNYLYLTTNHFAPSFTSTRLLRLPLTDMSLKKGFGYSLIDRTDVFNFVVAKNRFHQCTAYFVSNYILAGPYNQVRIFYWPESGGTYFWNTVTVSAWSFSGFICTTPDGRNPCGRMDTRILGAVVTNWGAPGVSDKVLWLSWNAGPITGRPKVYTYVVKINLNNWAILGYADIWNSSATWGYCAMGVNDYGHLALSLNYMGSPVYVDSYLSLYDNYTPSPPPGWQIYLGKAGAAGPTDNQWGDYNWVDQQFPKSNLWVGTGHVKPDPNNVDPYFYKFGREANF